MLGDEWWRQVLWVDIGSPFLWHAGYSQESFEFMDKVWVKVAKVAMPGSNGSHIFFLSLTCTVFHTPIIIGLTWNRGSFPCYIEFSVTYWKWLIWSIRKSLECIYTVWLFVLSSSLPLCFLSLSLSPSTLWSTTLPHSAFFSFTFFSSENSKKRKEGVVVAAIERESGWE